MSRRFEWDPFKAAVNLRKHGVRFEVAIRVFSDPLATTTFDRIEAGERRWQTVGAVDGFELLLVMHTLRETDDHGDEVEVIRLISARRPSPREKRRYQNG